MLSNGMWAGTQQKIQSLGLVFRCHIFWKSSKRTEKNLEIQMGIHTKMVNFNNKCRSRKTLFDEKK